MVQREKGLNKYGIIIDDNKNFDAEQYALKELADSLVYTSYQMVYKKQK